MTAPQKQVQVGFKVNEKVHHRLSAMARETGTSVSACACMLFHAAYAARHMPTGDRALDVSVARTVLLWGARSLNSQAIADIVGLSIETVDTIIIAWQDEARAGATP